MPIDKRWLSTKVVKVATSTEEPQRTTYRIVYITVYQDAISGTIAENRTSRHRQQALAESTFWRMRARVQDCRRDWSIEEGSGFVVRPTPELTKHGTVHNHASHILQVFSLKRNNKSKLKARTRHCCNADPPMSAVRTLHTELRVKSS